MKTLADWLTHIESLHPSEIELGLDRIRTVADKLSLLDQTSKVILVAGTNGKGSCCAMLESLALTNQKRVGCYTSPHLVSFNERIRVNGNNIDDESLVRAFQKIEDVQGEIKLTFFEFTTLAALVIFQSAKLDLIILEIGLGGRQDACNIIEPDVSVITTIAKDHIDWLGDSLVDIAYEKAGIIRSKKPAIIGDENSLKLVNSGLEKDEDFKSHSHDYKIKLRNNSSDKILDSLAQPQINPKKLLAQNIQLAIDAYECVFKFKLENEIVIDAIRNVHLSGRFQISEKYQTILDVAHNQQSGENLAAQLASFKATNGIKKIVAICGMMADKSIKEFLEALSSVVDDWVFVDLPLSRAASAKQLKEIYELGGDGQSCLTHANLSQVYKNTQHSLKSDEWLLVTGSFVTVGQIVADLN